MPTDRNGLLVLDEKESMRALTHHPAKVGRVGMIVMGRPDVLPVNYGIVDDAIVFRTAPGTKLDSARERQPVAFEADVIDETWEEGWSVIAYGHAQVVDDPDELKRLERLPVRSWGPGHKSTWVRVEIDEISGRQIV